LSQGIICRGCGVVVVVVVAAAVVVNEI